MGNPVLQEVFFIIFLVIKSNYSFYVEPFEDLYVFVGMMTVSLIGVTFLNRTHESHKFARNDPVDITILYALEVLIFLDIECLEIVPLIIDSMLKSL